MQKTSYAYLCCILANLESVHYLLGCLIFEAGVTYDVNNGTAY